MAIVFMAIGELVLGLGFVVASLALPAFLLKAAVPFLMGR